MKCFKKTNDDKIFNILNDYIQKYLLNLYYSPKLNNNIKIKAYNTIINEFKNKKVVYENMGKQKSIINDIFDREKINENIDKRIENEIKLLLDNGSFSQFKYITTIIIGKTGLGKSTLINKLLQLKKRKNPNNSTNIYRNEKAETGVGRRVTNSFAEYISDAVPFLRIIDTIGFELNSKFGISEILDKVNNDIIKNNKEFNDSIQCIWYCVGGDDLEDIEIKAIKAYNEQPKRFPLIIVKTHSLGEIEEEKMKNYLEQTFRDNKIEFIPTLSKSANIEINGRKINVKTKGLNTLLTKTFEICKQATEGDYFMRTKCEISKKVYKNLIHQNNEIKNSTINTFVNTFINTFNENKTKEEFSDYIYYLLLTCFKGYLNNEKISSSEAILKKSNSFNTILKEYFSICESIIESIENEKIEERALNFLDRQAKIELRN